MTTAVVVINDKVSTINISGFIECIRLAKRNSRKVKKYVTKTPTLKLKLNKKWMKSLVFSYALALASRLSFVHSVYDVMQFNAIACQCDDYWTLNILFFFFFAICFVLLIFSTFYFIFYFLLQWMCVSTRTHNDDCCSSISIIFYVACFFFSAHLKVDFFLLSHSLFFKIFFWSHSSRKKTPTHI